MDFSKLKLVTEALGNDLYSQAAKNTSDKAKIGHATPQSSDQSLQTQQKTGVVQPATRSAAATPVKGVQEYFDALRHNVDLLKAYDRQRMDWRRDLREDLNIDENDEDHPYVELMPFKSMKADEAKKLVKQEKEKKKKKKPSMNPQDMMGQLGDMAGGDMSGGGGAMPGGMAEETLVENKKTSEKQRADKDKKAKAAQKQAKIKRDKMITKAEKEFSSGNAKASHHARQAKNYNSKAQQAAKAGKHDESKKYYEKAGEEAAKAKQYRTNVGRKYVPVGSHIYSKPGEPLQMNSKYKTDMASSAGRRKIVSRVLGLGDDK